MAVEMDVYLALRKQTQFQANCLSLSTQWRPGGIALASSVTRETETA
jgi:hypothetical protein